MANKTIYSRIANLSFTASKWSTDYADTVLLKGEIGIETDTRKIKIGDGTTTWANLTYANPDIPIATTEVLGGIKSSSTAGDVKVNSSTGIATIDDVVASTSGAGGSHGLMTAAQAEKLAGIATGAQVNVLEGISFKGSGDTTYSDLTITDKKALLDLSDYPTFDDISAALNFKGSKSGEDLATKAVGYGTPGDLPSGKFYVYNGDVYSCSSDYTVVDPAYTFHEGLEYAATVDETTHVITWTELGRWVDLSGYVEKTQKINGEALSGDVTLDGADIALTGYAKASAAAAIAATDTINAAFGKLEYDVDLLNANSSTAGSVDYKVDQAVKVDTITVNGTTQTLTSKTLPFATGTTNGTIKVNGVEVAVAGLGSNAYTSTAYVPQTTTINTKALSDNIVLSGADIAVTGYAKASAAAAIAATDTINAALGKLEYKIDNATTGTVTSVGLSMPGIFTVTGSPVTTEGTLTAALATQSANLVFAGPGTGSAAAPTFRSLVAADIPTLAASKVQLSGATENHIAAIDAYGSYKDGGIAVSNLIDKSVDFVTVQCAFEIPS